MTAKLAIQHSAADLQERINEHLKLLCLAFSEGYVESETKFFCSSCLYSRRYQEALIETIETLERTKKSFKSKQLEALRKKLIMILAEYNNNVSNKLLMTKNE